MIKKTFVLWLVTFIIFGVVAHLIYKKEAILSQGTTMLLALAPVDPRSLMQGDYMTLNYAMNDKIHQMTYQQSTMNGFIVVKLDGNQVANIVRLHDDKTPLKENEHLLHFRKRATGTRIASEAFFFQEGHANDFSDARFGEIKVSNNGDTVLLGLRDSEYKPLTHQELEPVKEKH